MNTIQLQPFQQRVIEERDARRAELYQLMAFGQTADFDSLPEQEQNLLVEQSEIMMDLVEVLNSRIAGFYGAKLYACHKQVFARPMTRGEYNTLRGWPTPGNENGDQAGYLVEYLDGGSPNHPDFNGYISWSPKSVFENGYSEIP